MIENQSDNIDKKEKVFFIVQDVICRFFFQIKSMIVAQDGQAFGIQFKDQSKQRLISSWLFQELNIIVLDVEVIKAMFLMMVHPPQEKDIAITA